MDDVEQIATEDLGAMDTPLPGGGRFFPSLLGIEGALKSQRFTLDKEAILLGRDMGADILLRDPKTSRWHSRVVYENFGNPGQPPCCRVFDVGSTNGTHVNDERVGVEGRVLKDKDRIRIGHSVFAFFVHDEDDESLDRKLNEMITRDPVTGLLNMQVFRRVVHRETVRAKRYRRDLTLLLIGVDSLNNVRAAHGRAAGDTVLHHIATLLKRHYRANDLLARDKGDEIALLLPETDVAGADLVAERTCRAVSSEPVRYGAKEIPVTVCVGVADWSWEMGSADALMLRAEAALHRAQENGAGTTSHPPATPTTIVDSNTR
jgi:two-component system cell cycle response regulator